MRSLLRIVLASLLGVVLAPNLVLGQPDQAENPLSWDHNVRGLFGRYCLGCHKSEEPSGGIDLSRDENPRLILQNRDIWETVQFVLEDESMPPDDVRQPSAEQRQTMIDFLKATLRELDCAELNDPGPPPLRRLNRVEYDHAIFDLTGLDLKIAAETFPEDTSSYGFDNIGPALTMTPVQVQQYHSAARRIIDEIIARRESMPELYSKIWGSSGQNDAPELRERLQRFSDLAFRRPASDQWIDRLMALYQQSCEAGEDHETAVGHTITAILIAPQFLIRVEQNRLEEDEPYPVDDYELASRLSYFLWSRGPDEELLACAARGELQQPDVLREQTDRMLRHPHGQALVQNFFGQWLGLRYVRSHTIDTDVFPELDTELRAAMEAEVNAFLMGMIADNRPIQDLLDCDYGYLNQRLAKHYGLEIEELSVESQAEGEMRRVEFTDRRRGGILTSAAFLLTQSDPNRTNIPRRGNYIADRILGDPPPPPPPDVPPLEASEDGRQVSLRELFEKHRESSACSSCHARIDPFGFALENYDALGRWREEDSGQPIDPSGTLKDGTEINGPESLKDFLLDSRPAFTRSITKNLLIYALGRGLVDSDRCVVDAIVAADSEEPLRFTDLIWQVVSSRPFLYRRNPEF